MNPLFFALSLVILLLSVIIHEVMHGYIALRYGDETAKRMGRLTLNPIPHIDPIGTILVPLLLVISGSSLLFGWAKPVPVNPLNFSDLKKGEFFVSLAGVAANFSLSLIAAISYHLLNLVPTVPILVLALLKYTVTINLLLGVFNLFPIPPLDGSKVLQSRLSYNLAREFGKIEPYGFLILIVLLTSGLLQTILSVVVGFLSKILGF